MPSGRRPLLLRRALFVPAAVVALLGPVVAGPNPAAVVPVGTDRQLFVDRHLLASMRGVELRMHSPERREVVFRFDAPWEGPQSAYVTMLADGGRYRMYYRGGGDQTREVTCLAESEDGIHWNRPALGLFPFSGARQNNILWAPKDRAYSGAHNFTPFRDQNPAAPPEQRYKALALTKGFDPKLQSRRKMLAALGSPDGVHWKPLQEEPIIREGSFDSQNVAFWDTVRHEYVCYSRGGRNGVRAIQWCTSADFLHWTTPDWIDLGKTPVEQFYTNAIAPYFRSPGLYLGFPMRFVPERKAVGADQHPVDALSDGVLISSRDGVHWDRTFLEAFLRPGPDPANWGNGHGNNTPAWGLLPTGEGELSLYWAEHYGGVPQLRRGTLRVDGFASAHAPSVGGEFVTRLFVLAGRTLELNYATSAVGSVRVELQDERGKPLPGRSLGDCPEIYGDEISRIAAWKSGPDLSRFFGRTVRLRAVLKDADLYSFRFRPWLIAPEGPASKSPPRPGK